MLDWKALPHTRTFMDIDDVLKKLEAEVPEVAEEDEELLRAYGLYGTDDLKTARGDKTSRGKKMAMYLQIIHVHPDLSEPYFKLGQMLESSELVRQRNGQLVSRRDLWAMGIKNEPTNANAYYSLAMELTDRNEVVELPDGRTLSKRDLLVEALRHRVTFAEAYLYLAKQMDKEETLILYNDKQVTRRDLTIHAIECNPQYHLAYNFLAYDMEIDDVVHISGNKLMKKDVYLKSIHCAPHDARAYVNLGALLKPNETVRISGITRGMNSADLYLEALERDPDNPVALHNLAITLKRGESIALKTGERRTKRELLVRAIELNPKYLKAYNSLAYDLQKNETILLRSFAAGDQWDDEPKPHNKRQLYQLGGTVFMLPVGFDPEEEEMRNKKVETPPNELKKRKRRPRPPGAPPRPRKVKSGTVERLTRFFEKYDPAKLPDVEKLAALIAGREESRFKVLVEIYGPEPPDPNVVAVQRKGMRVVDEDLLMDDLGMLLLDGGNDNADADFSAPLDDGLLHSLQGGGKRSNLYGDDDGDDGAGEMYVPSMSLPAVDDDDDQEMLFDEGSHVY